MIIGHWNNGLRFGKITITNLPLYTSNSIHEKITSFRPSQHLLQSKQKHLVKMAFIVDRSQEFKILQKAQHSENQEKKCAITFTVPKTRDIPLYDQ